MEKESPLVNTEPVQSQDVGELAAALAKAAAEMATVPKSGYNKYDDYHYSTDADIAKAVRGPMAAHGLALVPLRCDVEMSTTQSAANKTMNVATLTRLYRLTHASGQWINVEAVGVGVDRGDKAVPKAETAALKYLLKTLFVLPTEGVDADQDSPQAPVQKSRSAGVRKWSGERGARQQPARKPDADRQWFERFERFREQCGVTQEEVRAHLETEFGVAAPLELARKDRTKAWEWLAAQNTEAAA